MCAVTGAGADAVLQPAYDRAAQGPTAAGEEQAAQDPAQRGQNTHGHVQEEPEDPLQRKLRRRPREDQAGKGSPAARTVCVLLSETLISLSLSVQFSRLEEKRQKAERLHQQQKHENQMREKINECEGNVRELQQLQVKYILHAGLSNRRHTPSILER